MTKIFNLSILQNSHLTDLIHIICPKQLFETAVSVI